MGYHNIVDRREGKPSTRNSQRKCPNAKPMKKKNEIMPKRQILNASSSNSLQTSKNSKSHDTQPCCHMSV